MKSKGVVIGAAIGCSVLALVVIVAMGKIALAVPFILVAAALFVRSAATSSDGAGIPWQRPQVLAAIVVAVLGALVLAGAVPGTVDRYRDLKGQEDRLVQTQALIASAKYDARGDVSNMSPSDFSMALAEAKYAPQSIRSARSNVLIGFAMSGGATLVLLACGIVIVRAVRKDRRHQQVVSPRAMT